VTKQSQKKPAAGRAKAKPAARKSSQSRAGGAPRASVQDSAPAHKSAPATKPAPQQAPRHEVAKGDSRMPNVRPLRDRILVRRIEEPEKKVGGIIVPDTAKEKPQQAEVIAVGSGRVLDNGATVPLTVKAGDKVLVGKWSGTDIKIEGEEYLILKEDEVLGILG
jgi:chaperonin GroES